MATGNRTSTKIRKNKTWWHLANGDQIVQDDMDKLWRAYPCGHLEPVGAFSRPTMAMAALQGDGRG